MATFELMIFDCDGVLVDSEPVANRVFAEMLAELGLRLSEEEVFDRFTGFSTADCLQMAAQMLGRPLPEGFARNLEVRTLAAFRCDLRAVPGIEHALDHIGLPFCVASSGEPEKMQTTLGVTGLLSRFDGRLFSAVQVPRPKPAPDVYLFAAEQMGVSSDRCVVVEDTLPGATAALAAGMTVLGYCAHTPPQKFSSIGVRRTFDDMRLLPALLRELEAQAMSANAR